MYAKRPDVAPAAQHAQAAGSVAFLGAGDRPPAHTIDAGLPPAADASLPKSAETSDVPVTLPSELTAAASEHSTDVPAERPYFLPELQRKVDDLSPYDLTPHSTQDAIAVKAEYGSPEVRQATVKEATAAAPALAEEFIADIREFMRSTRHEGARSPIANDYSYSMSTYRTHHHLAQCLHTARQADPDISFRVIGDVVEAITTAYNQNAIGFDAAMIGEGENLFHSGASRFLSSIIDTFGREPTDSEPFEALADSAFMQHYGNNETTAKLACIIARAQADETPDETHAIYTDLFKRTFVPRSDGSSSYRARELILQSVAEHAPGVLAEALAAADPDAAEALYLRLTSCILHPLDGKVPPLSPALWDIFVEYSPDAADTICIYLPLYAKNNSLSAPQLNLSKSILIKNEAGPYRSTYHESSLNIALHTPDEELVELAATFPLRSMSAEMAGIIVKRLAMAGNAAGAAWLAIGYYHHADKRDSDTWARFSELRAAHYRRNLNDLIHRLVDIYAETGDEQAWERVWEYAPSVVGEVHKKYSLHAHAFVAAYKQGDPRRVREQAALLEDAEKRVAREYHEGYVPQESIQAYLECNLPAAAEAVVMGLWDNARLTDDLGTRATIVNLTLDVVYNYAKAGLHADAQHLVMEYFMNPQRMPVTAAMLKRALDCARGIDVRSPSGRYSSDVIERAKAELQ